MDDCTLPPSARQSVQTSAAFPIIRPSLGPSITKSVCPYRSVPWSHGPSISPFFLVYVSQRVMSISLYPFSSVLLSLGPSFLSSVPPYVRVSVYASVCLSLGMRCQDSDDEMRLICRRKWRPLRQLTQQRSPSLRRLLEQYTHSSINPFPRIIDTRIHYSWVWLTD